MENITLKVEKRNEHEIGSKISRKLKTVKFIPAVMYGLDKEPLSIKVNEKELKDRLKGHNISSIIFDLHLDSDGKDKKEAVIIKEYQKNPITRDFIHLDFLRIQMKKEIETSVPIKILNEEIAVGIKDGGGVLQHSLRELDIFCLPADIPESIEVDIKDLEIGSTVRVSDIVVSDKIKLHNDPEEVIVSIIHATQLREEELVTEAAEELGEPEVIGKAKEAEGDSGVKGADKKTREE